jgi:hypothetical protein
LAIATITNSREIFVEIGTICGSTDIDNDDDYFPTIEELLSTKLYKEGFAAKGQSLDHIVRGSEGGALDKGGGVGSSIDHHSKLASCDNLGKSQGRHAHYPPS